MTNQQLDMTRPDNEGAVRDHWVLYLIEGSILVLLGALAAFMPPWFGIALFGWLFLVGGIAGLITTFAMWSAVGFWWSLLSAVFTIGVGGMLFAQPELGILTLFIILLHCRPVKSRTNSIGCWFHLPRMWPWFPKVPAASAFSRTG